jgi:hypothetical protein
MFPAYEECRFAAALADDLDHLAAGRLPASGRTFLDLALLARKSSLFAAAAWERQRRDIA